MPAIILAKTGKRYSLEEWLSIDIDERNALLNKFGPGYSDEAYRRHIGNTKFGRPVRYKR